MTQKQMYRAIRRWGISVVFDKDECVWFAGDHDPSAEFDFTVDCASPVRQAGWYRIMYHQGSTPEIAVEDYCNARNLEWDT